MSDERRYQEDEVRRIFEAATEADAAAPAHVAKGEGLTLRELEAIGSEVGIPAGLVSRAAAALDGEVGSVPAVAQHGPRLRRVALGVPLGVEHEVRLPRNLTDDEWGELVMDLRRTFSATGRAEAMGSVREWRNGNLYVAVTPAEWGARLSMGTRHGAATQYAAMSGGLMVIATVLLVTLLLTGQLAQGGEIFAPAFLGALGLGSLAINAVRLPAWARSRAAQFEAVGARARALTQGDPDGDPAGDPAGS